jgi:hypothetical protein
VAFLATSVSKCTEHDWEKLVRLLRYVKETKDRGVVFRPGKPGIIVTVYIDTSYGVHADGKSHTGSHRSGENRSGALQVGKAGDCDEVLH